MIIRRDTINAIATWRYKGYTPATKIGSGNKIEEEAIGR